MNAGRGEFTRKFDREILGDATAEAEEREAKRKAVLQEDRALEEEFEKIIAILDYRARWLTERFAECRDVPVEFRGRRFEFTSGGKLRGSIQFQTRLTDSEQGITVESTMDLEGAFPRRHDYVNFPKERVQIDRVKRFVEAKLTEYAGAWRERYGTS